MAGERRCYGCAESFDRAALKDVGDAVFCAACFGALLAAPAGRERGGESGPRQPATPADAWQCVLCKSERQDAPFLRVAAFAICRECSEELRSEEPSPEPAAAPARDEAASPEVAPAVVYTPGSGTEVCAGCSRLMPGPGSYRTIEGRPYCPGCAPLS